MVMVSRFSAAFSGRLMPDSVLLNGQAAIVPGFSQMFGEHLVDRDAQIRRRE